MKSKPKPKKNSGHPAIKRSVNIPPVRRCPFPIQPIEKDRNGRLRFRTNAIVNYLLEEATRVGLCDLNELARMNFSDDDRAQFAMLIGYSLPGFSELSYVSTETYRRAIRKRVSAIR